MIKFNKRVVSTLLVLICVLATLYLCEPQTIAYAISTSEGEILTYISDNTSNKGDIENKMQEKVKNTITTTLTTSEKDIKNATRLPNELNKDKGKIFTDHFEVYRGKYGDHLIEVDKNNGPRRFYMTRSTPSGTSHATSTDSTKSANNIIAPIQNNLNPSQQSIQAPMSHNEWLEELKRRRKKLGWW